MLSESVTKRNNGHPVALRVRKPQPEARTESPNGNLSKENEPTNRILSGIPDNNPNQKIALNPKPANNSDSIQSQSTRQARQASQSSRNQPTTPSQPKPTATSLSSHINQSFLNSLQPDIHVTTLNRSGRRLGRKTFRKRTYAHYVACICLSFVFQKKTDLTKLVGDFIGYSKV